MNSLLEPSCGAPSPLVVLSKNVAATQPETQRLSTSTSSRILPPGTSNADLIVNEYLSRVTTAHQPNTFDMHALLSQVSKQSGDSLQREMMERSWNQARALSKLAPIQMSSQWIDQFSNQSQKALLEEAWNSSTPGGTLPQSNQLVPSSSSQWATDFLDRFDSSFQQGDQTMTIMTESWINEFVGGGSDFLNRNEDDALSGIVEQYEDEWNNIQFEQEPMKNYHFNSENPFATTDSPIEKAEEMFRSGNISDAILCYETALQHNPAESEVWCSLGLCHAENESDVQAIAAFRKALISNPNNNKATLALSVSLANEGFDSEALRHLDKWISVHTNASEDSLIDVQTSSNNPMRYLEVFSYLDKELFTKVERKFLTAIQTGSRDAELQNALGILYNLNRNYDQAVDCLKAAVHLKPEDPVLWNRLGASLANGDRSAEAIGVYRKALELFPAYVRARYNLGVSCMNLNSYREAIGHFISALQLQKSPEQSQIWSKLRSALIRTENYQPDAIEALERRDLAKLSHLFQ